MYNSKNHDKELKWFITYPAIFITLWGIYQWLTTFDILPYVDIFNNSLSTKFTYERFKYAHRTASVFPEPSEYAYFLAFMIPFAYMSMRDSSMVSYISHPKVFALLVFISIILCQSMSLFIVLPIIILYIIRKYVKISLKKLFILIVVALIIMLIVLYLMYDRIIAVSAGDDGSAIIRYEAFISTINLIKQSPFIGVGFGAVRGLDLLSYLFATTGIIGVVFFVYMVLNIKSYSKTNALFIDGFKCMLIVAMISNPIIDLTFFWPILAFISIPLKNKI